METKSAQSIASLGPVPVGGDNMREVSGAHFQANVEKIVSRSPNFQSFNRKLSELAIDTHCSEDERPEAMPRAISYPGQSEEKMHPVLVVKTHQEPFPSSSVFQQGQKPKARKSPCMEVKEGLKLIFGANGPEAPLTILCKKTEAEAEKRRNTVQQNGQYMSSHERTVCSCFLF